ncbi:MAG: indole-3-glycerol phosphate synthase TrpC [Bryobacteraceae bacterium]|jgi:indole-3-glycerol phosphate synthase
MLDRIIIDKKAELAQRRADRRDFARALTANPPAIIAEIKKASPSRGLIAAGFDPSRIARAYELGGAAAISVLTDQKHFQGSLADLESARAAVRLPVLRKDFTIDPFHVLEAAAHDADAILLIVAVLSDRELRDYRELAASHGMAALVEVHDGEELKRAVVSGAEIIGVNNRDLRTFEVRLETSLELAADMPANAIRVAESGIRTAADVRRLRAAGYHACLVGEHLMTAKDPAAAVRALLG